MNHPVETQTGPAALPRVQLGILKVLWREIMLFVRFTRRDWTTTIVPASLFLSASLKHRWPVPPLEAAAAVGRGLIYFGLYIYTFCLANQIAGVDEDRINKPDRPLPAGLVSMRGAIARWIVSSAAFLAVGATFGVLRWAVLWEILAVLHCFLGWGKHWFTKNHVIMPLGGLAELAPAWELGSPLTPSAWRWLLVVSMLVGLTAWVQDLRDVAGDRAQGRRTLPIILELHRTRLLIGSFFLAAPVVVHSALMSGHRGSAAVMCEIALGVMSVMVAVRVFDRRATAQKDDATYTLYTYWYSGLVGAAIVLL